MQMGRDAQKYGLQAYENAKQLLNLRYAEAKPEDLVQSARLLMYIYTRLGEDDKSIPIVDETDKFIRNKINSCWEISDPTLLTDYFRQATQHYDKQLGRLKIEVETVRQAAEFAAEGFSKTGRWDFRELEAYATYWLGKTEVIRISTRDDGFKKLDRAIMLYAEAERLCPNKKSRFGRGSRNLTSKIIKKSINDFRKSIAEKEKI